MGSGRYVSLLALLVALTACCCHNADAGHIDRGHWHDGLKLSDPFNVFSSDGGRMDIWDSKFFALQDAGVAADRISVEPRGLALPKFSDAPKLAYVLEGNAQIGLSFPNEERLHVRNLNKGDLVAIPRGVGHWLYNNGDNRFTILSLTDTSNNVNRGEYDSFYLNGGLRKEWGSSLLHAFDEQLLSEAFNVDTNVIRQVRENQEGAVIVKVQENLHISRTDNTDDRHHFTFNLDDAPAVVDVENGGSFRIATEKNFPILREIGFSAHRLKLAPEALFAPSYLLNAHAFMYVTRGKGRAQVVGSNDQLMDAEVAEGSMIAFPRLHPGMGKASTDGIEVIVFATNSKPKQSFLAGSNSVYRNFPIEVLAASDNVDVDIVKQLQKNQKNAIIIPNRHNDVLEELKEILKHASRTS